MKSDARPLIEVFVILTFIFSFFATSVAAQDEKPAVYKIEVQRDGSAIWTVETRIKLETKADIDAFNLYKNQFEANKSQNLANFSARIINSVNDASSMTGRSMLAKDFDAFLSTISAPTGTYGVISYRFNWTNFAKIEGSDLKVGDVFAGGMYLSREEALIITPPPQYEAKETAPKPDDIKDSALIWYGMRGFAGGEPRVLISQVISMSWIYAALAMIAVLSASAFYMKRRKEPVKKEADFDEAGDIAEEKAEEAGGEAQFTGQLSQSDEDLIIDLLKKAGGEMYQSEIIEKTNFSKSKVSAILSDLKAKGLILKIKKGRENLIRLVK